MPGDNGLAQFGDGAFCLLVGISKFKAPDFAEKPLPQATWDAEDLRDILCERLAWKPQNVAILSHEVKLRDITGALTQIYERIQAAERASLFLMYLSTHGHLYEGHKKEIQSCLLASDSDLTNAGSIYETALTRSRLGAYIGMMAVASRVVIADACYSVSALRSEDFNGSEAYAETSAAVLASSPGLSFAKPNDRNSLSTMNLLEVLRIATGPVKLLSTADQLDNKLWKLSASDFGSRVLIGVAGAKIKITPLTADEIRRLTQQFIEEAIQPDARLPYRKEKYVRRLTIENKFRGFLRPPHHSIWRKVLPPQAIQWHGSRRQKSRSEPTQSS